MPQCASTTAGSAFRRHAPNRVCLNTSHPRPSLLRLRQFQTSQVGLGFALAKSPASPGSHSRLQFTTVPPIDTGSEHMNSSGMNHQGASIREPSDVKVGTPE